MKILLFTIVVSGLPLTFWSQSTVPIGFGNTHTYSEEDGIDAANFVVSGITNDGRVFLHANFGPLYIKGDNYVHKIIFPSEVLPRHITHVLEIRDNQYVLCGDNYSGDKYYYFLENDSLKITRRIPDTSSYLAWVKIGNEIIAASDNNLYRLEKDSLVLKLTVPKATRSVSSFFVDGNNDNLWIVTNTDGNFKYYRINHLWKAELQFSLHPPNTPSYSDTLGSNKFNIAILNKSIHSNLTSIYEISNPNSLIVPYNRSPPFNPTTKFTYMMSDFQNSVILNLHDTTKSEYHIRYTEKLMVRSLFDPITHSFYFATMNKPFRFFPYLKMYPGVFNHTSSSAIFSIAQDSSGRIWTASYEGGLSIFNEKKVKEYFENDLTFLTGSFSTRNHVYLNAERNKYHYGLLQYDMKGHKKDISGGILGFYEYLSKDKRHFYFGTYANHGLWETDLQSLESEKRKWKKMDSAYGNRLRDIESITEDAKGRIWMGGTDKGFAIYYPDKNKVSTWLISSNETDFGFWSSCIDNRGTVWLGTNQKGLMFYNDYKSDTIDIKKIFRIEHPLLPDGIKIMQLKIWGNWLLIGIGKNMLAMNLEKWYNSRKVFIRYINPQEGNFSAALQENAILVDHRDSTVWFATADMLYQWDIKEWLSLPIYKVKPNLVFHTLNSDSTIAEDQLIKIKPTDNSLKFSVWFQSRDNMPRYMSVTLIKKGDSLVFPSPSLQTSFEYSNLAPGNYQLFVQICQSDGSVSINKYAILIKKFWWQYWWIWAIFFLLLFIPIVLWIQSRNKAKLVEERARRREAEQQKLLSTLQIVSLGNQFRPHFILNTLNTVGAELDNKPQAEAVLSRLGESIDLIFSHSQQQKIAHSLADEWILVKNVIDIHRMMYLKELETDISEQIISDRFSKVFVPLGLVQIPVENALLHGLSNKENGPWKLIIEIDEREHDLIINIVDNGVGRLKAAELSNYRKHGAGTKNLNSILKIVNAGKDRKIIFTYIDGIFSSDDEEYGTKVSITIPKNFQYEI